MFRCLLILFSIFLFFDKIYQTDGAAQTYTVHFDQIKFHNGSALAGYYNFTTLRVAKFNRSTFVFNYEGELLTDYGEKIAFQADIYNSRLNNNQYTKSPANIPRMTACEAMNRYYKTYAMKDLKEYSNLPQFEPDDDSCIMPKVRNILLMHNNSKVFQWELFLPKKRENII